MPLRQFYSILLITLLTLMSSASSAQGGGLTGGEVERYIQSLREIEPMAERISSSNTDDAAAMAQLWMKGDTGAVVDHLKGKEYFPDLASAVEEAGFDSVQDWVNVAQQVTKAYMAVEMGNEGAVAAAELQANMDQIKASAQFSDEQKKMMMEQFENMQSQLRSIQNVSAADRETIKPYMDQLRAHFQKQPSTQQ